MFNKNANATQEVWAQRKLPSTRVEEKATTA